MFITLPKTSSIIDRIALFISTLGPAGRFYKAPGTWGSLFAIILAPYLFLPLPFWARLILLVVLFPFGAWCASRAELILSQKDPSCVVVDELWGQWIVLIFMTSFDLLFFLFAFILFRFFDILKPWPVRSSEMWLPRGWGIMIDDGFAGLYALIVITILDYCFT